MVFFFSFFVFIIFQDIEKMEYSSAIKVIRDSGKTLNLTISRQVEAVNREKLAEFILNDLI